MNKSIFQNEILDDVVPNNKINFIKLKRTKNKKFNKTYSKQAKKNS